MEQRKDSQESDLPTTIASTLDPDGEYVEWLLEHLRAAPQCTMDPVDIVQAFEIRFQPEDEDPNEPLPPVMSVTDMEALVVSIFPDATLTGAVHATSSKIKGVRWKALGDNDTIRHCGAADFSTWPNGLQAAAEPLLEIPLPDKKQLWAKMYFMRKEGYTVSVDTIMGMYIQAFAIGETDQEMPEDEEFAACLEETFKCERVLVATRHAVLIGVTARSLPLTSEQVLVRSRRAVYRRMEKAGLLEFPAQSRNIFTEKLRADPLLSLPLTKEGYDKSPFIDRLHRRQENPRLPLGDEEPGFPDVSMRMESRRWKRKWEEFTMCYRRPPTKSDWDKAAAEILATLPTSSSSKQ